MPVTQEAAFEMKTIVVTFKGPNGDVKLILFEGLAEGIIIEGDPGPREDIASRLGIDVLSPELHSPERFVDAAESETMSYFVPELHSPERLVDPAAGEASSFVPELYGGGGILNSVHAK